MTLPPNSGMRVPFDGSLHRRATGSIQSRRWARRDGKEEEEVKKGTGSSRMVTMASKMIASAETKESKRGDEWGKEACIGSKDFYDIRTEFGCK